MSSIIVLVFINKVVLITILADLLQYSTHFGILCFHKPCLTLIRSENRLLGYVGRMDCMVP